MRSAAGCPRLRGPLTLADSINRGLADALVVVPEPPGLRRGRRAQGRGLRSHPRAGPPVRRRPGLRLAARRAVDPRARARCRDSPGCFRCRRSSTSPTCTTPKISSGARRPACSSSPPASTAIRWWCEWRAWPTRRASAGISTTTTPSRCCATSPAWSSPCPPAETMPPPCCGRAWPPPTQTVRSACSWSRSRCTTRVTSTSPATAAGCALTLRPSSGRTRTSRSAAAASTAMARS